MRAALRIEKLQRIHSVEGFDCGQEALNRFLIRYALQNQQAGASQTYVALSGEEVIGYYSLVVGQVEYADAPARLTKGVARHPVPIMLLARLAAKLDWQGKGIGSGLLKDAMLRTLLAYRQDEESSADQAGVTFLNATKQSGRGMLETLEFMASKLVGVQGINPYLMTHPMPQQRIVQLLRDRSSVGESAGYRLNDGGRDMQALAARLARLEIDSDLKPTWLVLTELTDLQAAMEVERDLRSAEEELAPDVAADTAYGEEGVKGLIRFDPGTIEVKRASWVEQWNKTIAR